MPPRILLLAGSTAPAASANLLAGALTRELAFLDAAPTRISLADYTLPLFDPDALSAAPAALKALRGLVQSHDAVFLVTPSRHGAMPAIFRNLLEWLGSREAPRQRPLPPFALAATAEDDASAAAALSELHMAVSQGLGATIIGGGLAIGRAGLAFDAKGGLDDPRLAVALQALAREIVRVARALGSEP